MNTDGLLQSAATLCKKVEALHALTPDYNTSPFWFAGGLEDAQIAAEEARLGITLPPEHRAVLRCHDGISEFPFYEGPEAHRFSNPGLKDPGWTQIHPINSIKDWGRDQLLGLQQMRADQLSDPEYIDNTVVTVVGPAKRNGWTGGRWLMIGATMFGEVWLDFDPEPGGRMGQVLLVEEYNEDLMILVAAPDFMQFLERICDSLELYRANPRTDRFG